MSLVLFIDTANWLGSFCAPVRNWSGLLLRRPIDMEKRDSIQHEEASLLDLRSYLFSRQCTLLIFLQRPWEVTQRALELLHNCVQELRLLEVGRVKARFISRVVLCRPAPPKELLFPSVRCPSWMGLWTAGCSSAVWRFSTGLRAAAIRLS